MKKPKIYTQEQFLAAINISCKSFVANNKNNLSSRNSLRRQFCKVDPETNEHTGARPGPYRFVYRRWLGSSEKEHGLNFNEYIYGFEQDKKLVAEIQAIVHKMDTKLRRGIHRHLIQYKHRADADPLFESPLQADFASRDSLTGKYMGRNMGNDRWVYTRHSSMEGSWDFEEFLSRYEDNKKLLAEVKDISCGRRRMKYILFQFMNSEHCHLAKYFRHINPVTGKYMKRGPCYAEYYAWLHSRAKKKGIPLIDWACNFVNNEKISYRVRLKRFQSNAKKEIAKLLLRHPGKAEAFLQKILKENKTYTSQTC